MFSMYTNSRLSTACIILFLSSIACFSAKGQNPEIKFSSTTISLAQMLETMEAQSAVRFVFSEDEIRVDTIITLPKSSYELNALLKYATREFNLGFKKIEDYYVVTNLENAKGAARVFQNIRGKVLDAINGETLPAATVFLVEYPEYGTTTDADGNFLIKSPIGRVNVTVSFIGYESTVIPMLVNTGQEPYLTIDLQASISSLNEVSIEAERDKAKTQNVLTYGSGRGFTVLEANRYAGTLGDPARMARSFAGVLPARDDRNDIIIRGNSPTGIQWRIDDIEVPNPNHYGGIGLTGNTTTLLNMNLLGNSDFMMGAFSSEYGNALSGVFDLHTKKINPKKRQYRFQTGWNGLELGAEGPFSKKKSLGTYSLTYRYSFLDVVDALGIDFGVLPKFQDITGKFDFKLGPKTDLAILGIWGTSFIELDDHDLDSTDLPSVGEYLKTGSDLALLGVSVNHRVNDRVVLKTGVSVIDNRVKTEIDTFNIATDASTRVYTDNSGETKYSFFAKLDHQKGKNHFRTGVKWDTYQTDYNSIATRAGGTIDTIHKNNEPLNLARLYAEDEYRFTDRLRARAGLHSQYFFYNESFALEPRMALRYMVTPYHALALSYGNHHMLQPRNIYFVETETANGSEMTNKDLDFSAAHHLTLSYDYSISKNFRLKAEAYYQDLYNIPVEMDPASTFSMVNVGADFFIPQLDSLTNQGLGRNYGLEVTLERFLDKGYYFMLNGAWFKSEYQSLEGQWRSTAFDMRYTVNALGGYEKWMGQKVALGFDFKLTYAGGKPFVPVNETASLNNDEVVFDESRAFESHYGDYFRTDLKLYYRINYKHVYTEFAMDLQNLTNNKNVFQREFDTRTGDYQTFYHMTFFPMFTFRCLF